MGRRLRTRLDMVHPDSTKEIRQRQEEHYANNKKNKTFKEGDLVYAKDFSPHSKWLQASIQCKTRPVSYKLITETGKEVRRHIDQIRERRPQSSHSQQLSVILSQDCDDVGPWPSLATLDSPQVNNNAPLRRSNRARCPVDRFAPLVPS